MISGGEGINELQSAGSHTAVQSVTEMRSGASDSADSGRRTHVAVCATPADVTAVAVRVLKKQQAQEQGIMSQEQRQMLDGELDDGSVPTNDFQVCCVSPSVHYKELVAGCRIDPVAHTVQRSASITAEGGSSADVDGASIRTG